MTTKSRRKRGFSLIELLIAMVVTLIIMTDAITVSDVDPNLETPPPPEVDLRLYPTTTISANGDSVTLDPATSTTLNDPGTGVKVGDVFMLTNTRGSVTASVSGFPAGGTTIAFASGNQLGMKKPNT